MGCGSEGSENTVGGWVDGLPTLDEIRKRVITELVDADVRFANRRDRTRRARVGRRLRRHARRLIG
jgi:hypothetical protein